MSDLFPYRHPDWYDDDDDLEADVPYYREEDAIELGPCCVCGKEGPTVRNLISLEYRAPVPGTGWGCVVCGLPADGAMAVVCDACLDDDDADIEYIINGYAANKGRLPINEAPVERFDHDYSKHPEAQP